jgi:predicted enzyme related to lactoylglutathione lyase
MKIHYLEIVTQDIDNVCETYEQTHSVKFSEPDESLGNAKTCKLHDGTVVGVRRPMHDAENSVIRPYWLVEDLDEAVAKVKDQGAEIALPRMDMPGKGTIAIYILDSIEYGFWQL